MNELLEKWPLILAVVISVNLALSGVYAALGKIKDITQTSLDNKVYDFLGKVVDVLQKIIEFASGNPKNK